MKRAGGHSGRGEIGAQAWLAVLQAQSVVSRLIEERLLRETGLPLAWFEVLLHLGGAAEGHMRMNDLAHGLVVSRSGVTRLIDRISADGLVVRSSCPTDRRVIHVEITGAGRSRLAAALPVHARAVQELFVRHMNAPQMRALIEPLTHVIEANGFEVKPCVSAVSKRPPVPFSTKAVS